MAEDLETLLLAACLAECTAPKVGNVHPNAGFEDLTHDDFVRSSAITAKWLCQTSKLGIGSVVESAAREIAETVGQNTQLGILLLLAPLAAAKSCSRPEDLKPVLASLTVTDAQHVYRAIRLMEPAGLGEVKEQDVQADPTETLLECMRLAADRDTIARQYVNGFADVFRFVETLSAEAFERDWKTAVVTLQIDILSAIPDTLIERKCGPNVAEEAMSRANAVRMNGYDAAALAEFDGWLRADGHRRNPGTTADLVAAILFVVFRHGRVQIPHV